MSAVQTFQPTTESEATLIVQYDQHRRTKSAMDAIVDPHWISAIAKDDCYPYSDEDAVDSDDAFYDAVYQIVGPQTSLAYLEN